LESRKIIKFGKSSYVVSLPKDWLTNNSLTKGDLIFFNEVENNLVLIPKSINKKREIKSLELNISKLDIRDIERRIISAYIQDYNIIRIIGKDLSFRAKEIKELIHNLMALEIMEETSEKIIAKDFLKMEDLSPLDLIKRIDIITRAMLLDTLKLPEEGLIESIYQRDLDVNRLTYLVYRTVQYLLSNQSEATHKGLNTKILLRFNNVARNLERVADCAKRIGKLKNKLKFDNKLDQQINSFIKELYSHYENIMKTFYKKDTEKALEIANKKRILIMQTKQMYEDTWKTKEMPTLIEKFKDMIDSCHNINRDLYH
jgi:phosphate uptake regulator